MQEMPRNGEGGEAESKTTGCAGPGEVFINNATKNNTLITGGSNTAFSSPQNSDSGLSRWYNYLDLIAD